ncbi:MAG: hypothetical protein MZV63_25220 [Marinilabiliales bacterium]|nr:hypothetical protein [Marinilabiliales bacterium]
MELSPRWLSIHGARTLPTPWWCESDPPFSTMVTTSPRWKTRQSHPAHSPAP